MTEKVSFTIRRPTPPESRGMSPAESSGRGPNFKIPALPRHLSNLSTDSTPLGSPLTQSEAPSPQPYLNQDYNSSDEEEDEELQDQLVTGFDRFGVERIDARVDPTPDPPSTSIRSRLRSHTSAASTAASTGDPHHPPATLTGSGSAASSRKRKRAPTKATSNKKPKVEAEFEWKCPVPTCNRVHVSVKMNGVWGPEKERMLKKGPLVDLESAPRGVLVVFA
ncbi:hypothetical protein NMY22_g19448 [Coprinellus aureogranulatus]|nr:hypothetical protein NMY22_g19448 [Coprinellus aureogranulatus]